jgi:hypothetical protein
VYSSPAIGVDGTIYVGSANNYIYALNPDGTLKWRYQTEYWVGCTPAIGADGTIYIGSADGYIYALNPDGTLKWRYQTGHLREFHSAIGADGTVYIGSTDNYLYAIHGGTPLATSAPWPKFHNNSQNTGRSQDTGGVKPSAGLWSGNFVAFNVSGDGSKITWEGSKLLDPQKDPYALRIGPIKGSGGCKDYTIKVFYKTIIPISDGKFTYSYEKELTINGTFTSETASKGQLSAEYDGGETCSGNFQKSGSWQAQASSSANKMLSTYDVMSPVHVIYNYNEAGETISSKVLYLDVSGED